MRPAQILTILSPSFCCACIQQRNFTAVHGEMLRWLVTLYLTAPVLAGDLVTEMDPLKTTDSLLRLDFVDKIITCNQVPIAKDRDISSVTICPHLVCPPGWILLQDTCFLITQDSGSWEEGQNFCRQRDGSLATVSNDVLQETLSYILTEDNWIGLAYLHSKSKFGWVDGSDYKYSSWAPNASSIPDIPGQYCVYMGQIDQYLWHIADCGERKQFLCTMKGSVVNSLCGALKNNTRSGTTPTADHTTTTTTTTATNLVPECPSGWIKFHSSCYQLFQEPHDYEMATDKCKKLGTNLAIISDIEEHNFIKDLLQENTYIGLDALAKKGTFIWQDGSPMEFNRFADNEPNDRLGVEDCVEMRKGFTYYWNDMPCDRKQHFVCETRHSATEKQAL